VGFYFSNCFSVQFQCKIADFCYSLVSECE
jgi:hypothetical protein